MAPLTALLVDVGGTLVRDETWLPRETYHRLLAGRLAGVYDGTEPEWAHDLLAHAYRVEDAPDYEHRLAEEVTAFLVGRGLRPSPEEVDRVARACAAPLSEVVELEPDARAAMEAARRLGLRMAICSNTLWRNDEDSRRDWTDMGFGHMFDAYVTSNGSGVAKPHRRIFERALGLLDSRPAETAMLGDQLARDVAGAAALGLRTIWKRPASHEGAVEPEPDATIGSLSELEAVLREWVE